MVEGYSTNVISADGSVEREVFDIYIRPTKDETKVWIDNVPTNDIISVEIDSVHSVDESFITNIDTRDSSSVTYSTEDLKHREEILNNLIKKRFIRNN